MGSYCCQSQQSDCKRAIEQDGVSDEASIRLEFKLLQEKNPGGLIALSTAINLHIIRET